MTAEVFRAQKYIDDPPAKEKDGGFSSRVHTVEGVTPPARWRPEGQSGLHRTSVEEYKAHDTSHQPYSSAHRPAEPQDLDKLKANQTEMLTTRAKRKRKEKG